MIMHRMWTDPGANILHKCADRFARRELQVQAPLSKQVNVVVQENFSPTPVAALVPENCLRLEL